MTNNSNNPHVINEGRGGTRVRYLPGIKYGNMIAGEVGIIDVHTRAA